MDPDLPPLLLRSDALNRGYSDAELLRARRTGALQSIRRGAYASPELLGTLDSEAQHRLLIEATLSKSLINAVVSHTSAAVLHRVAMWNPALARVHLTIDAASGGRIGRRRHVHAAPLADSDVVTIDGIQVTSVARTIVDFARSESFEKAVAMGDSALQQGLVTPAELDEALAAAHHRKGTPGASRAIAFMDGRSESIGESRSRVLMLRAGLPRPDLQRTVLDLDGMPIGRVDFYFEQFGAIGEFDGMGKYALAPGQSMVEALRMEKLREDALRSTGAGVARWMWEHLATPEVVIRRLRRAFDLSRG